VQDIFLNLWRAWPSFRGDSSVRTFVLRVAHNVAFDHVRRRYRNLEDLVEHDEPAHATDPTDRLSLERAVHSLRVPSRQVALLALEGLTPGEIAEVLGISEGNAAVRLSRARAELKAFMKEEGSP
jgi:RNA polymerase sigma-70 factor (ECF subfamily)